MSFSKAQDLFRLAEMAKARYRGVTLRDIMEEFAVNERTARRMARALEDVFPRIDVVTDDERRRWWSLRDVDYIRHRGFRDSEIAALDLAKVSVNMASLLSANPAASSASPTSQCNIDRHFCDDQSHRAVSGRSLQMRD